MKDIIAREYKDFREMYNISQDIIRIIAEKKLQLNILERIKYIRLNYKKEVLNSFYYIGILPQYIAETLQSKTTELKLSMDSLLKNIIEHPEISIHEYLKIQYYMDNAEYILLKNPKNLIYFKVGNNIYQFVIKTTKNGLENFITTFHKTNNKQLHKDIKRYKQIKR